MSYIREELAILRGQKDNAFERKKLFKRALDEAKERLNSFQPEFEQLSEEQQAAQGRLSRYRSEAKDARRSKSYFTADEAERNARNAVSDIESIKHRRQELIRKQQEAKTAFQGALDYYRRAKDECDQLVEAYNKLQASRQDRKRESEENRFEKYSGSSNRDTGTVQTDLLFGEKGTKGGHIVVDEYGVLQYVRDDDGTVIFDRKNGIGSPPPGWE